jgi:NAD(P)-dependent dehydrogenase (short-subunit alcohol dehydrogenase family)
MEAEIIVLTGANNGIGLALTQALVAAGNKVAAVDMS